MVTMPNFKLSDTAEADLIRIYHWGFERYGQTQADEYFSAFFDHFEQLAEQPLSFPVTEVREGYRRSVCGSDSVYYRINSGTVEIMAIIGAQDADQWL